MSERFHRIPTPGLCRDCRQPWKYAIDPFRIAPHVWCVGSNVDVGMFLLDTGDGLALIDTGMAEFFYLLVDGIWRAGFDPRNVKNILLSHMHGDHVNGARYLQEMSGAKIWISSEDDAFRRRAKLHFGMEIPFEADAWYDDAVPLALGRFSVRTRLTPGHTPGTTSFFFEDRDDDTGKTWLVGMHGGAGTDLMRPDVLAREDLPQTLAHRFVRDCAALSSIPVDICLPSHLNQINLVANIPADRRDYTPYIDRTVWPDFLAERAAAVRAFYPETYGTAAAGR